MDEGSKRLPLAVYSVGGGGDNTADSCPCW